MMPNQMMGGMQNQMARMNNQMGNMNNMGGPLREPFCNSNKKHRREAPHPPHLRQSHGLTAPKHSAQNFSATACAQAF